AFASECAARAGAPIRVGRAPRVPKSEDEARRLRYDFLRRAAAEVGATAIATGHTRDDQAETVLLHLARGSGIAGLAAMRPEREGIVRPLLRVGRADTEAACRAIGVVPRDDPSNRSLRFARNRIRRRILPELEAVNPQIREALARLADAAAEAADSLRARAAETLDRAERDGWIALDLLGEDDAVASDALALAWERWTGRVLSAEQRSRLLAEARRRSGSAALDLPGGRARREYDRLRAEAAVDDGTHRSDEAVSLAPGTPVEWSGWTIALGDGDDASAYETTIPRDLANGLVIRGRRPGDRMAGPVRAKVQDVLTDAKVPARLRSVIPLVVTRTGEVWWVPGVASAALAGTPGALRLAARPPRGDPHPRGHSRVGQVASMPDGVRKGHGDELR
ncbi:MAG: tRNA lysidine(34) synthetase TilS, partial [Candidatus Limnocylindria bacterium]